jgi:NADPH:quinone reductase-like Zn-dependent oxidoreductase
VQLAHLRKAFVSPSSLHTHHDFPNALEPYGPRRRIVGTVSSAEKIEFLKSMPNGPTDIVNYKTTRWPEEIKKLADGVDVIVDFIGGDYWEGNVESLNADGRLVLLATMGGWCLRFILQSICDGPSCSR